jgi:hypothetical protein
MSEIPFVNQLGDELERAAKRAVAGAGRRRRRRLGLLAVAGALAISGSALAGGLLSGDAEEQAAADVACYDGGDPDFEGSVALVPRPPASPQVSPEDVCRRAGLAGPLVACADENGVAVIPGRDPSRCEAAGFAPLGPAYYGARDRVARLERGIMAIEDSADCITPQELMRRVQRLLDSTGWTGWSTRLSRMAGGGPCATISYIAGDGRRYISLLPGARPRTLRVVRSGPRRITELLYSAERTLLGPLFAESGATCFTFDGLRERIGEVFAAKGVDASVRRIAFPRNAALDDEDGRWTRYLAGCAIVAAGGGGATPDSVVIDVFQKH